MNTERRSARRELRTAIWQATERLRERLGTVPTLPQIAAEIGEKPTTVHYHIRKLCDAGIVRQICGYEVLKPPPPPDDETEPGADAR